MAGSMPLSGAKLDTSRWDHLDLMSSFPTGVAVITAVGADRRPHGLTCTSLTSVTLDPPTLLVCLNLRSGTLGALREAGAFAVNLLHARARRTAAIFASRSADRFEQVSWRPHGESGVPWLVRDAFALAECLVVDDRMFGDHAIVVGEVAQIAHAPDVPLLYGHRRFADWPAEELVDA